MCVSLTVDQVGCLYDSIGNFHFAETETWEKGTVYTIQKREKKCYCDNKKNYGKI